MEEHKQHEHEIGTNGEQLVTQLSLDDIDYYFNEDEPQTHRMERVLHVLTNLLVYKDGYLYKYHETTRLHVKAQYRLEALKLSIYKLFINSFGALDENTQQLWKLQHTSECKALMKNRFLPDCDVRTFAELLLAAGGDIEFDADHDAIHFINGRYDLRNGVFGVRTHDMYITQTAPMVFFTPEQQYFEQVDEDLRKLYPDEATLEYMKAYAGGALSGRFTELQTFMCHYGVGSSGKSSQHEMMKRVLGDTYVMTLPSETFNKGNKSVDKVLAGFKPHHRLMVIEELDTKRQNTSLIKQLSGNKTISYKRLYHDGVFTTEIHCTLMFVSNHHISFKVDTGINRRIRGYEYTNRFVDEGWDGVTTFEKKQGYADNASNDYLMAYFISHAREAKRIYEHKGKLPNIPPTVKQSTEQLTDMNDEWKGFIEEELVVTGDDDDRIGRDEMCRMAKEHFRNDDGKKNLKVNHVMAELKSRGITYEAGKRHGGERGVYVGVKLKYETTTTWDADQNEVEMVEATKLTTAKATMKQQRTQIEELQRQLEEQRQLIEQLQRKQTKKKKKKVKINVKQKDTPTRNITMAVTKQTADDTDDASVTIDDTDGASVTIDDTDDAGATIDDTDDAGVTIDDTDDDTDQPQPRVKPQPRVIIPTPHGMVVKKKKKNAKAMQAQ